MRVFAALFAFAATALLARAADVELVRVWPGWRDAESFERISEYFTNEENPGREVIVRTHPDSRGGFYFLVRVASADGALPGARFAVQVIMPGTPEPVRFEFPAELKGRSTPFQLGLTGPDWPGATVHPVAWKIDLLAADGQVLASKASFLWEKPAK